MKASSTVADALDAAAGSFEVAVERTGDLAADFLESAGHAAQAALRGGNLGVWSGRVVAATTDLAAAVTKGGFGTVAGGAAGLLRILAAIPLLDARRLAAGFVDAGSSAGGAVILVAGKFVSLIQRLLLLEIDERPLTDEERDLLSRIFTDSVLLDNVRIVEGRCGVFGLSRRPFAMGNTIYFKKMDPRVRPDILVHECVHVWQYQNVGARYAAQALMSQAIYGRGAYDWRAELGRGAASWKEFNKEAQAQLIQDIWSRSGISSGEVEADKSRPFTRAAATRATGDAGESRGTGLTAVSKFVVGERDYTELALDSIAALRSRGSVRLRNTELEQTPHGGSSP